MMRLTETPNVCSALEALHEEHSKCETTISDLKKRLEVSSALAVRVLKCEALTWPWRLPASGAGAWPAEGQLERGG
eukprot:2702709-Rhodomonas_salina.2